MTIKHRKLVVAVAIVGLSVCGSAYAFASHQAASTPTSPFQSLAVANQAAVATALIAPEVSKEIAAANSAGIKPQLIAQTRAIGTVGGNAAYVVPAKDGDVCFAVVSLGESCTKPFTKQSPAMFGVFDPDGPGGVAPSVFGLTMDGVQSVLFSVDGAPEVIPVHDNTFFWTAPAQATTDDFSQPSVTFADGSVVQLP